MTNKEAIDLLDNLLGMIDDNQGNDYDEAIHRAIETLSAEPEEFEWCHDCKEYDQEQHCCHRWTKVIRNTVAELKAERWIPCSERLPKEGNTTYLTTVDYGEIGRGVGQRFFFGKNIGWEDDAVVAWMPLPEPYREEEE